MPVCPCRRATVTIYARPVAATAVHAQTKRVRHSNSVETGRDPSRPVLNLTAQPGRRWFKGAAACWCLHLGGLVRTSRLGGLAGRGGQSPDTLVSKNAVHRQPVVRDHHVGVLAVPASTQAAHPGRVALVVYRAHPAGLLLVHRYFGAIRSSPGFYRLNGQGPTRAARHYTVRSSGYHDGHTPRFVKHATSRAPLLRLDCISPAFFIPVRVTYIVFVATSAFLAGAPALFCSRPAPAGSCPPGCARSSSGISLAPARARTGSGQQVPEITIGFSWW